FAHLVKDEAALLRLQLGEQSSPELGRRLCQVRPLRGSQANRCQIPETATPQALAGGQGYIRFRCRAVFLPVVLVAFLDELVVVRKRWVPVVESQFVGDAGELGR